MYWKLPTFVLQGNFALVTTYGFLNIKPVKCLRIRV